jgi:hypothetical protein
MTGTSELTAGNMDHSAEYKGVPQVDNNDAFKDHRMSELPGSTAHGQNPMSELPGSTALGHEQRYELGEHK